ncbi:MAG: hypothetical protein S4CHLAM45_09710 [Chlamydiales bacterium]|nr:hypothetical protein [Chlamydiales bacterium]MCH9620211.1 hypothetical protein [Chlamydiales bacterium]MCH9623074.1 hypothetical protein [Chlamydiales bacterium]
MLNKQQKEDQIKAEISLHILRALLPIDEKSRSEIETCSKALRQLMEEKIPAEKKGEALNTLLAPLNLTFKFLTDEIAKEYIMNNPNVHQVTKLSAEFLSWASLNGNFKDFGLDKLVHSIFAEVNKPKTSATDALVTIQQALGAAMLLLKFRKEGPIPQPQNTFVERKKKEVDQ